MELRDYQQKAVEEIRKLYRCNKKKVLLHLATGGGKTLIFCHILKSVAEKGNRALIVVRGRKLVQQASDRLAREGVAHEVWMANRPADHPINVCSIDTLYARKTIPDADLIVIDEAHMADSESYHWLVKQLPDAFYLAVTATPYGKDLTHVAEHVVKPISMRELIAQGHLVEPKYFVPYTPDLSNVKITANEYNLSDLESTMIVIGDVVENWVRFGENRPTLAFAVTVKHSLSLVQQFLKAGINAAHLDASSSLMERESVIAQFESGEIKVIANVGILGVGVDIPCVGCIIMARPTRSRNLYIQQCGRATRPFLEKRNFVVIDHSGNVLRHGDFLDEISAQLTAGGNARNVSQEVSIKRCPSCFLVVRKNASICPECEYNWKKLDAVSQKAREHAEGKLTEYSFSPNRPKTQIEIDRDFFITKWRLNKYKKGWVFFQLKELHNELEVKQSLARIGFWLNEFF